VASPDLEKQGFFLSRSFYLSGIKRTAGNSSKKKTQSYTDYFAIFMPQKSLYAVFQK
jgi:hypothetical protein